MIQLSILSGQMAGDVKVVRRFPFGIGRAATNGLCLEDTGVWDYHLRLEFARKEGYLLKAQDDAFVAVNEQPQKNIRLRHGDIISFGSTKIQFWLAAPRQRGLRLREGLVWGIILAVTLLQIGLLYALLR